jgi:hypothetical protein
VLILSTYTQSREGVATRSTVGHYPTDVSDAQWEGLQLLLPKPKQRPSRPRRKPLDLRRVINGIFYGYFSRLAAEVGLDHDDGDIQNTQECFFLQEFSCVVPSRALRIYHV